MLRSVRLGFATNSSSAHSIVLHSSPAYAALVGDDGFEYAATNEHFEISKLESKFAYLLWAHQKAGKLAISAHTVLGLMQHFGQHHGMDVQRILDATQDPDLESDYYGGVLCRDGIELGLWIRFMAEGPVSIHGWYDNNTSPLEYAQEQDKQACDFDELTFRQDGTALVAYNPNDGFKFRWSPDAYTKATLPELVDLKITDHCGWGCKFCYQGSTKEGKHAPYKVLTDAIDAFAAAGVFEIAVGGGEPVEHPRFADLLTYAVKKKVTLNFTTFGVDWAVAGNPIVEAMKASYWKGGIGVSVHSLGDLAKVDKLAASLRALGVYRGQVMAQTVVGVLPMASTRAIVEASIAADRQVLLLGYKTTGRGASFKRKADDTAEMLHILETAKEAIARPAKEDEYGGREDHGFSLSVDTAFLDTYGSLLDSVGIPTVLRTSPEGKFSMYVDAVTGLAAPSSYADPSASVAWKPKDLQAIFAAF
jgi:Radical SAM superfamily